MNYDRRATDIMRIGIICVLYMYMYIISSQTIGGLTGRRSRFPCSLSSKLLARGLPSGGLAGSLLGTGHGVHEGERVCEVGESEN